MNTVAPSSCSSSFSSPLSSFAPPRSSPVRYAPAEAVAAVVAVRDHERPLRIARQVLAWLSAVALALSAAANLLSVHRGERLPMLIVALAFVVGWALLERRLTGGFLGLRTSTTQAMAAAFALLILCCAAVTV